MASASPQILVVDDESAVSGLLEDFLETRSYRSEAVASGEEAVQFLEKQAVPLVICDLRMPGLAGAPLVERMLEIAPTAHIVIMTGGLAEDDDCQAALQAGAVGMLHKPFKLDELQSLCRRHLSAAL